ncbi:type I 3-dehydroquinate dehydratase [Secundilactobacillus collinoides]|uniref:3-dehydroquinate dehydratase n=2 Tax=Secundilactobacillus collinoides TaxID=33960 RepID=A0A0R2BPX7_SECCO|nr:type I 3-dehydroquinate dehydratase [Secundilactobacillus collinoides]KRM77596.1 3-dehydroquinate dehydratase [Secundilactobacillus collinoides DSM 20515 = JCM 1123]KZL43065.1 3-dehydroquinate dehydratase [Secundilactobacillus collinoides]
MANPTVKVGNTVLGSGRPKIAVPITGKTEEDILTQAADIKAAQPDVVEWRIDFFEGVLDASALAQTGKKLHDAIGDLALLTTFRTNGEGGELVLDDAGYFQVCENVIAGQFTDALDVERYHEESAVKGIIEKAHAQKVVIIMSNHDFDKTPAEDDIVGRLTSMVEYGADVAKMAVMPNSVQDVITLLKATHRASLSLSKPIITMSMGDLGKVSRMAGEVFGSSLSFGTVGAASAPGQVALDHLKVELEDLKLS